jgi:hypothetical protein
MMRGDAKNACSGNAWGRDDALRTKPSSAREGGKEETR